MATTKVTGMMQTSTKGGDIPSASPTVIDTDGDYFDVSGTTSFAAFTVTAGRRFTIQFDGALTMTHHATTLDLPGGANITTAAGDVAEFFATGTNTVQCVNYTKADGTAVVAAAGGVETFIGRATFAMNSATGTDLAVTGVGFTPKLINFHMTIHAGAAVLVGFAGLPSLSEHALHQREAGTDAWRNDAPLYFRYTAGGDRQEFTLDSLDSDGFTLANTLVGASPAGTLTIDYACIG